MEIYEKAVAIPDCQNVGAFFYLGVLQEKTKDF